MPSGYGVPVERSTRPGRFERATHAKPPQLRALATLGLLLASALGRAFDQHPRFADQCVRDDPIVPLIADASVARFWQLAVRNGHSFRKRSARRLGLTQLLLRHRKHHVGLD